MTFNGRFLFKEGCSAKATSTTATQAQRQLDINLRHNELQAALYRLLISKFGTENVGTENDTGIGTSAYFGQMYQLFRSGLYQRFGQMYRSERSDAGGLFLLYRVLLCQ